VMKNKKIEISRLLKKNTVFSSTVDNLKIKTGM
jgi:hypothetical protein